MNLKGMFGYGGLEVVVEGYMSVSVELAQPVIWAGVSLSKDN